ncbi:MAG: DUF996 domain-containing protein [Candidatus Bathyarchaeota archaeon]|nr:DUF996 domain-containing protein [Candidatus Bathyarchaeota archaeon]
MSLESNSSLGGIGTILIVLSAFFSFFSLIDTLLPSASPVFSFVSFLGVPLGLVGLILLFISLNGLSRFYQHSKIFNSLLYAFLTVVVGFLIVFMLTFALVFLQLSQISPTLQTITSNPNFYTENVLSVFVFLVPVIAAAFIMSVVSMVFLMRAFNALAEKSCVTRFRTAGVLFPVSAAVAAVFLMMAACLATANVIHFASIWVIALPSGAIQLAAWILIVQGFFELRAQANTTPATPFAPQNSVASSAEQKKCCPLCGAPTLPDAVYCAHCGNKLS